MPNPDQGRRKQGISSLRAGVVALVIVTAGGYVGFTKAAFLDNPYQLEAVFESAYNLKPRSPVRVAGVEVGKVSEVEALESGAARVTMELEDEALPIRADAHLKIRPRIFLEGNFFIDLRPGSPTAPELSEDDVVPMSQTDAPVQFADVLAALQSDTRTDLRSALRELAAGLDGEGAEGFNRSIRYWEEAYRNSALANDAALGTDPERDLRRIVTGQQRTARGLARNEAALANLVSNLNSTAGALAENDGALAAALPALRDTLTAADPALASLDSALPELEAFADTALPGVRSAAPTLAASQPLVAELRAAVGPGELQGAARVLRRYAPALVSFTRRSVALGDEGRQLAACTNNVLVPFMGTPIPDPDSEAVGNSGQLMRWQLQRDWPGLAGESRVQDANTQVFHTSAVPSGDRVRPAPPPDGGSQPPPHRPDVPCETQEPPDLNAPGAKIDELTYTPTPGASYVASQPRVSPERFRAGVLRARQRWQRVDRVIAADQLKNLRFFRRGQR